MTNAALQVGTACLILTAALCGCVRSGEPSFRVHVKESTLPFGSGDLVHLYELSNGRGMTMTVMNYGATVLKLSVPDRDGRMDDIVLGFARLSDYRENAPLFGSVVGRYAGRIAYGKFSIDERAYSLPINDAPHSMHGGYKGFSHRFWRGEILPGPDAAVRFRYLSRDGEEGFPGNLDVAVTYRLTSRNKLIIDYEATTDRPTVVNLTSHMYFNLDGVGSETIRHHKIWIKADRYAANTTDRIPTGELHPVRGTPLDFRQEEEIGARLDKVGGSPRGYNDYYVFSKGRKTKAAKVVSPQSGRSMTVITDQPGIQFYTGNYLDHTVKGKGDLTYGPYSGFCLETQHFPDSPNRPQFPSTILRPGEVFRSQTTFVFGTVR